MADSMTTDGETWAIDARGLSKTFGTVTAVRGVTLQVPSGTIFAFLGPNGSGKSTTVKLLTGLLAPTAGEARVIGRVVSVDDLELRREIGVLPEDDALFPDLTILGASRIVRSALRPRPPGDRHARD
jgi:ABC-type multidrug transport system ATPase subunit